MLQDLRACKTVYDLADLLGIPAKILTFLLYKLPDKQKYKPFCISKKNGATRHIMAPELRLKSLQRRLCNALYECQAELEAKHGQSQSFGFKKGRGIYDNARRHDNMRWVFNIDLKDFFPSFNFGRVRGYFLSNSDFSLDPKIATLIAQIACFDNQLPQGAPSSPIISDLISGSLDFRLSKLSNEHRCNYSRYADDITFSTNLVQFPSEIARPALDPQGWETGDALQKIVDRSGFALNTTKTRMSLPHSRQMVTGLVVNSFPNSPFEQRRHCRASVHRLLKGIPLEIERFSDPFDQNCPEEEARSENSADSFKILDGKITHCFLVRDRSDFRDSKKKFFQPTSIGRTFSDFLIYKYFVRGTKPIILTEGPSDITYLKSTLKSSKTDIPNLCAVNKDGESSILIEFYNFPRLPGDILGLSGGSGNIKLFLEKYNEFRNSLSKSTPHRPVVILLDNDDGIDSTLTSIKSLFRVDIKLTDDKDYYHITRGIVLVKTPTKGKK